MQDADIEKLGLEVEIESGLADKNLSDLIQTLSQLNSTLSGIVQPFKKVTKELTNSNSGIKQVARSAKDLSTGLNKVSGGFKDGAKYMNVMSKDAKNVKKDMNDVDQITNQLTKSMGKLGKTTALVYLGKQLADVMADAVNYSMQYIENLNLFEQSMGRMSGEMYEFIQQLNDATGIDQSELIRYAGIFNQMSKSLGLTEQNAYNLSKTFLGLGLDMASFYNITNDEAFIKLRAGLAGESEPLRRLGIIITENNLAEVARQRGIEKSIRKMTEAEKIHLRFVAIVEQATGKTKELAQLMNMDVESGVARILEALHGDVKGLSGYLKSLNIEQIAMEQGLNQSVSTMTEAEKAMVLYNYVIGQTSGAMGDFARTIETPANQMKMLVSTTKSMARALGDLLLPMIGNLLPYLNAFMLILKHIFNAMASIFGINKDSQFTGKFEGLGADDLVGDLEDANASAKKLKQTLFGFDEVNVIPKDTGSGAGGVGGLGGNSIQDELKIDDIYGEMFENVTNKAKEMSDAVLEYLGIIVGEDDLGNKTYRWDAFTEFVEYLKTSGAKQVLEETAKGVMILINPLVKLGEIGFTVIASGFYMLDQALRVVAEIIKPLSESLKWFLDVIVIPLAQIVSIPIIGLFKLLADAFKYLANILKDNPALAQDIADVIMAIGMAVTIVAVVGILMQLRVAIMAVGSAIATFLTPAMLPVIVAIAGAIFVFKQLYDHCEGFRMAVDWLVDQLDLLWKAIINDEVDVWWENFKVGFVEIMEQLKESFWSWIEGMIENVVTWYEETDAKFREWQEGILQSFLDWAIGMAEPFINAYQHVVKFIDDGKAKFDEWLTKIKNLCVDIKNEFKNKTQEWATIVSEWIELKIKPLFTLSYWSGILSGMWDAFMNIFEGLQNFFSNLIDNIISMAKSAWDSIKSGGDKNSSAGTKPVSGGQPSRSYSKHARGGMLGDGSFFQAGESGKAELIGEFNNKTTVMPLENTSFVSSISTAVADAVGNVMLQVIGTGNDNNSDGQPIVLELDGKKLAKAIIPYSKDYEGRKVKNTVVSIS